MGWRVLITALTFFTTAVISQTAFAQLCGYGVYSQDETNIRDRGVTVSPGMVGSATKVEIGVESNIKGDVISSGDVFLRDRCMIGKNVFAGGTIFEQNQITVGGDKLDNVEIQSETITFKTVTPGSQDYNLYNGNSLELAPGSYGNMHIYDGGVLTMSAGTYNFASFVVEAGNAVLNFNLEEGFLEINVQNDLRFGDRNQFILSEDSDPAQVQFYTNSSNQVKVGTDSTFNGVITAPNAQIYVFSRCTVNGALYGKSVWIDTDTTINLVPNCTAYNTTFDYTPITEMCSALNFESEGWIPVEGGNSSEVMYSDTDKSYGDYSLEVSLNSDQYLAIEGSAPIQMAFSEGAQSLTAKIDVLSNAAQLGEGNGSIALYLMAEDDETYTYAGTMAYDPDDPYTEQFLTLETFVPENIAQKMLKGIPVYPMLYLYQQQSYTVFWIDKMQFCDDTGLCNSTCPSTTTDNDPAPDPMPTNVEIHLDNEDSASNSGLTAITGYIKNVSGGTLNGQTILSVVSPFAEKAEVTSDNFEIENGETANFIFPISSIPLKKPGYNNIFTLNVKTIFSDGASVINAGDVSEELYYNYQQSTDTITVFNNETLREEYNNYLFNIDVEGAENSTQNGIILSGFNIEGIEFVYDTDSNSDEDSDTVNDTSISID
ncbi:MAG: hypothetical protein JXR91_09050 [Deltaproteobacteria bacterium]|nr:hypothetical protein [Deltaproteobacteria bacterium]